ncbi:MAG TPA: bifunctional tetrahydrofolate synthase/dihydrofolate synthase [Casimicrobiaceae bacterium]|nr:bifunctional tetrahydrofolate synthase/dihydrofolate synthase [Casimicrobiaceae bacterium]
MSRPASLPGWLAYLETLHPKAIALGLERVTEVYSRLAVRPGCPTVIVGGTNGKGSTATFLERMLGAGGYRAGLYTSPHLLAYNERVRVSGALATDAELCAAFDAVESARGDTPLTYFEFGTLAAFWLFERAGLDAWVLEVGLGGRLDAVNVIDADVAVVTTVAIDHTEYLGPTREDIGREKAGIFRAGRPAICADPDPPQSLPAHARSIGARLLAIGADFGYAAEGAQWRYYGPGGSRYGLPHPALRGGYQLANAAAALTALDALRDRLPVAMGAVREALVGIELPGRFQVLPGRPVTVLDVAHNPQAARAFSDSLASMGFHPRTLAVFGIMSDKDVDAVIAAVAKRVDLWLVATLPPPRGAAASFLAERLSSAGVAAEAIRAFDSAGEAFAAAQEIADEADRIIVFGSFLTVAAALASVRTTG